MKTTAITIITAGTLLGATAALAQGTNAGAIPTNPGAIGTKPGAIGSVPYQSLQPLTGGQGLGYSTPSVGVSPGVTGLNNPTGSISPLPGSSTAVPDSWIDPPFCTECYWYAVQPIGRRLRERTCERDVRFELSQSSVQGTTPSSPPAG